MPRYRKHDVVMGRVTLQPTCIFEEAPYEQSIAHRNTFELSSYTLAVYKVMYVDALVGAVRSGAHTCMSSCHVLTWTHRRSPYLHFTQSSIDQSRVCSVSIYWLEDVPVKCEKNAKVTMYVSDHS